MPRRQFLASLLFGSGALTLAGLQSVQAQQHPTEGWTLPDLNSPTPKPEPEPTPPREPPLAGKPRVPQPPPPPTAGLPVIPQGRYISPGEASPPPPPPRP